MILLLYSCHSYSACKSHLSAQQYIIICGPFGSTIFFHFMSKGARFYENVNEYKICVFISSTTLVGIFFILRKIQPVLL